MHLHGEIAGAAVDIRPLAARRRGTQIRKIWHTVAIGVRRRRWWRRRRRLDARHRRRRHGHRRRRRLAAETRHERKHVQIAVEAIVGVCVVQPLGDHADVLVAEHDHRSVAGAIALITGLERRRNRTLVIARAGRTSSPPTPSAKLLAEMFAEQRVDVRLVAGFVVRPAEVVLEIDHDTRGRGQIPAAVAQVGVGERRIERPVVTADRHHRVCHRACPRAPRCRAKICCSADRIPRRAAA